MARMLLTDTLRLCCEGRKVTGSRDGVGAACTCKYTDQLLRAERVVPHRTSILHHRGSAILHPIPYTIYLPTFSEGFGGTGGRDRVDPVHGSNTDASARQPTSGCDV